MDERIRKSIKMLKDALEPLEAYVSGRTAQKAQIAARMGITPQALNRKLNSLFRNEIKKITTEYGTYEALYDAIWSPSDALICDMLLISAKSRPIFPYYDVKNFWERWVPSNFKQKEEEIIRKRYIGRNLEWYDPDARMLSLEDVGCDYGITKERVRQIISRAFEKIRNQRRYIDIFVVSNENVSERIAELNSEIAAKNAVIMSQKRQLSELEEMLPGIIDETGRAAELISEAKSIIAASRPKYSEKQAMSIKISRIGLNPRSYNALTNAGITRIRDIMALRTIKALSEIKNLGRGSIPIITRAMIRIDPSLILSDEGYKYETGYESEE